MKVAECHSKFANPAARLFVTKGYQEWARGASASGRIPSERLSLSVIVFVYHRAVTSSEFTRWLSKQGATFEAGKGSHLKVSLNGRNSILPIRSKDLKKGLVQAIEKQLGLT
jgi:mRNA interferase HicA